MSRPNFLASASPLPKAGAHVSHRPRPPRTTPHAYALTQTTTTTGSPFPDHTTHLLVYHTSQT